MTVGSATATLAARLAALPTTSSAHGRNPPRLTVQLHEQVHVQVRDRPGDQRHHPYAPDRRPPDPSVRPARHRAPPSANSPVSTHWLMGALPPRTLIICGSPAGSVGGFAGAGCRDAVRYRRCGAARVTWLASCWALRADGGSGSLLPALDDALGAPAVKALRPLRGGLRPAWTTAASSSVWRLWKQCRNVKPDWPGHAVPVHSL
jgi:hypothetical protein